MPSVVLDMMDRRPVWAMPDWVPAELRAALPVGWRLVVIPTDTDGSGDGAGRLAPDVVEAVREADAYFGFGIPEALLEAGPKLRWVHTGAAGVANSLTPKMLESPVVFTNSARVHGPPIAETVLAMILYFGRGLDFAVEGQRRGAWWTAPYYDETSPLRELSDSTIGIVGYGGIGREVARRVASLGAHVIALARRPERAVEDLVPVQGGGSLGEHVRVVTGRAGLERLLAESDAVVLSAPETRETQGLLGSAELALMKPGALVVNVSRGKVVDESALVLALSERRLRGAGLDVFAQEPLPAEHPLWRLPNVLLTPHVSAVTRGFWRRETDLILANLARFLDGRPSGEWDNVVDKRAGY
jgi:phosphoglycerate dehydrogenase-like enzyme